MVDERYFCPLCRSTSTANTLKSADNRLHYLCDTCYLIFCNPEERLSAEQEKSRYLSHRNGPDQQGHVDFLNRVLEPLVSVLPKNARGLDFGSGPVPTASVILERDGHHCDNFDPYFNVVDFSPPYDFILCTEVMEHFSNPRRDISQMISLLAPQAYLAIMTELWTSRERFSSWYYSRDPTHVSFYHLKSIEWICNTWNLKPHYSDERRVFILSRRDNQC